MPWQHGKQSVCISKYDLAIKMLEWAINNGFPNCIVQADSWFGIGPFIKGLKRYCSKHRPNQTNHQISPHRSTHLGSHQDYLCLQPSMGN